MRKILLKNCTTTIIDGYLKCNYHSIQKAGFSSAFSFLAKSEDAICLTKCRFNDFA